MSGLIDRTYRACVGLSLADGSRVEVGDERPESAFGASLSWLLESGAIEPVILESMRPDAPRLVRQKRGIE